MRGLTWTLELEVEARGMEQSRFVSNSGDSRQQVDARVAAIALEVPKCVRQMYVASIRHGMMHANLRGQLLLQQRTNDSRIGCFVQFSPMPQCDARMNSEPRAWTMIG